MDCLFFLDLKANFYFLTVNILYIAIYKNVTRSLICFFLLVVRCYLFSLSFYIIIIIYSSSSFLSLSFFTTMMILLFV